VPYTPCTKSHDHFHYLRSFIKVIYPGPRLHVIFSNKLVFLGRGVVSTTPNHQSGGSPLFGCPQLLIQYIGSYRPYLDAVIPYTMHNRMQAGKIVLHSVPYICAALNAKLREARFLVFNKNISVLSATLKPNLF
jgi:hypothetical protein